MPNPASPSPPSHTSRRTAPLTHRLSNPPPLFKGRQAGVKHLREAIKRGPVTVVCGMGGIGKTALVLETLHRHFEHQVRRVLQLRVPQENQGLLVEILRVLAVVQEVKIDWSVALSDPEYALVTAIDLADEGSWWVVLEDLHLAPWQDAQHTLEMLAQYARRSRWIVTSRLRPAHHMGGQVIELQAMETDALAAIATSWIPNASALQITHHVQRAAGSPWRLYQSLSGGNDTDPNNLDNLSDSARGLLKRLAILKRPVPLKALGKVRSEDVDGLVRRGLAVRAQGALRIHDAARPEAIERLGSSQALYQETWQGLWQARHLTEAALEVLRLTLDADEDPGEVLDGIGQSLIDAGYSPELAALLEHTDAKSALQWQFYAAAEIGDLTRLTHMELPEEPSAIELLQWSRALFELNRFDQTVETIDRLEAMSPAPAADVLTQAQILKATALLSVRRAPEALELVESIKTNNPALAHHVLDAKAGVYAFIGRKKDAVALIEAQCAKLPQWDGALRHKSAMRLVSALYFVNEFDKASALFKETQEVIGPRAIALAHGRKSAEIKMALDVVTGNLRDMEEALERLPKTRNDQHAVLRADLLRMLSKVYRGQGLDSYEPLAQHILQQVQASNLKNFWASYADLHTQYQIIKGIPYHPANHHDIEVEQPIFLFKYQHRQCMHALLWDQSAERPPAPDDASLPILHIYHHVTLALEKALGGHPQEGLDAALKQLSRSKAERLRLDEFDIQLLICNLLMLANTTADQWPTHIENLQELATLTDSERLRIATDFFEAVRQPDTLQPQTLEAIAQTMSFAPCSARRAQVLLGQEVSNLDRLDRQVLQAIQHQPGWRPITTVGPIEASPVWGIDLGRKRVWKADGHSVDLSRRARLWALLETLTQMTSADKETLVVTIWPGEPYHPLKHDNRLRLAVRRLRDLCQDDGSMLQTTHDGYALGGRWRLMHPPRQNGS